MAGTPCHAVTPGVVTAPVGARKSVRKGDPDYPHMGVESELTPPGHRKMFEVVREGRWPQAPDRRTSLWKKTATSSPWR